MPRCTMVGDRWEGVGRRGGGGATCRPGKAKGGYRPSRERLSAVAVAVGCSCRSGKEKRGDRPSIPPCRRYLTDVVFVSSGPSYCPRVLQVPDGCGVCEPWPYCPRVPQVPDGCGVCEPWPYCPPVPQVPDGCGVWEPLRHVHYSAAATHAAGGAHRGSTGRVQGGGFGVRGGV